MDKEKEELIRSLLSNNEVRETLKKILLEEQPVKEKKTRGRPRGSVKNKTPENNSFKTNTKQKVLDKNSKEYGRSIFVDNLTEAIQEEVDGNIVNLLEESKKISNIATKKTYRKKATLPKSKCSQCNKSFTGVGYLCDSCLRGRNAE